MGNRLMSEQEKAAIARKSRELLDEGREEEAAALRKTIPLTPYLAKYWKEKMGAKFLINGGWNLAEAEAEYGQGWLDS